ncbi:MAG TPA: CDP-alcohol phosphatidyltransferase family protein [Candidatus Saccharimonadales bacterium]|nr:CDP-alcohol phosphatidyltransferase family protein [Candidatus Saccharimonadales bacterium]
MTISNDSRTRIKGIFEPIALAMGRAGLTPDGLTLIGFAITVVGAILLASQQWLIGGIVVFIGGVFDMFDGTLARATGKVSPLGAFMDSVFDRWGEVIVYVGIVIGCVMAPFSEGAVAASAALGAAVMVSYVRSKSEGLGFTAGTGMAAVGLMPREIRLVILSLGLVVAGLAGGVGWYPVPAGEVRVDDPLRTGSIVLLLALAAIAVGGTITVIQRILHVRAQANRTSTNPEAGPPASNGEANT